MTKPQKLALLALYESAWPLSPSSLGYAMTPDREFPLRPQGAGRIGGAMAWRLRRKGWVQSYSSAPQLYALTDAGIQAIKEGA